MSRHIESEKVGIDCPSDKVYNFLSNFDNFAHVLPEQVAEWHSTGDSCSFEVKGLTTIGLRIVEKIPYSKICIKGEGKLPFGFSFNILISEITVLQCMVQIVFDSDMSPFMAMMAEKPLLNFADMILHQLKKEMER